MDDNTERVLHEVESDEEELLCSDEDVEQYIHEKSIVTVHPRSGHLHSTGYCCNDRCLHVNCINTGSASNLLCQFIRSWHGTVFIYLCLLLVFTFSLLSVLVLYVQVFLPFWQIRDYYNGTCRSVSLSTLQHVTNTCLCGVGCKTRYRCVKVSVTYLTEDKQRWINATLYENEYAMRRKQVSEEIY